MGARKYLVGMLVLVLLIWGPINHSWPAWFVIRLGYLIAIPVMSWFILGWIWKVWKPDTASEERLDRVLGGAAGGVLLVVAILAAMAKTHIGNTMWVRTHDGMEAVGDDLVLPGPDWGNEIMLVAAAGFSFWFSMAKMESKQ